MKTTLFTSIDVDEVISDVALFFLVTLTALAALNFVSFWVLLICYFFYVIIGFLVACILPHEQRMQENEPAPKRFADPNLDQLLKEVRKSPESLRQRTSTENIPTLANGRGRSTPAIPNRPV